VGTGVTTSVNEGPSAVVPAVGTAGSLATVRSLGRHGVHTVVVSEDDTPPSFSSRYCDEKRSVPSPRTDLHGYRDALLALAARDDVKAIIPVREEDVYVLAKHRAEFAEHLRTPWPTFEKLRAVHDRLELFAAADRAGVSAPETCRLDEVTDWSHERIVKGRHAVLTAEISESVPEGRFESPPKTVFLDPGVEPDIEALIDRMGHVPIAQEFVDGTEYCFRALYRDGEAVATSQKKLIRGYKYSRGPSIYHEAVDLPGLEAAGLALLDELEWEGLASVGFIERGGEFALLEINPRIPARLPMDVHAGVDYPVQWWDLFRGAEPTQGTYWSGTASHLLRGELVHLHSVAVEEYALADRPGLGRTALDIGGSVVANPTFDILSRDDPRPFVRDALNVAGSLLSRK
jgi:predicted ATP-grasp superfamily ATP-dependent carboligase